jgi:hypothetical protein
MIILAGKILLVLLACGALVVAAPGATAYIDAATVVALVLVVRQHLLRSRAKGTHHQHV